MFLLLICDVEQLKLIIPRLFNVKEKYFGSQSNNLIEYQQHNEDKFIHRFSLRVTYFACFAAVHCSACTVHLHGHGLFTACN